MMGSVWHAALLSKFYILGFPQVPPALSLPLPIPSPGLPGGQGSPETAACSQNIQFKFCHLFHHLELPRSSSLEVTQRMARNVCPGE